jgi:thiol-disulfide isomerase/thioredoxin
MKNTLLLILLLPMAGMAQGKYTISGKLPGLTVPAKAYFATLQGDAYKDKDSVAIKDGKFQFTGSVNEPDRVVISVRRNGAATPGTKSDEISFFLENSKISIAGTDSIKNATISGSISDKENKELGALMKPLTTAFQNLNREFYGKPKDEAYKKAVDSINRVIAELKNTQVKFAESHRNSYMGLFVYHYYVLDSYFDPAKEEPLFHQFPSELQSTDLGKRTLEKIEAAKRRQVGIKAADFTQNDLNGKPFTLSSLRGKYVLVDFWASWCAPCRAENPNLIKAYAQLKDKNFEVVGVSLDDHKGPWEYAVKKDSLPWIHVCDLKGWKNGVALMYGITSVPQNLLIDPQGVIIAKNLRGEDLTEKLSALIK